MSLQTTLNLYLCAGIEHQLPVRHDGLPRLQSLFNYSLATQGKRGNYKPQIDSLVLFNDKGKLSLLSRLYGLTGHYDRVGT